jgi:4-carboxymuconolactone decarboxylase
MPRVVMPTPEEMTPEQRAVYENAAAARRGQAPAPLAAWLQSPELAQRAQQLGEFVRYHTSLPPRLSELAILITARHWTAHYEWYVHKPEALTAGLDPAVVTAIAAGRPAPLTRDDELIVYSFSRALHEQHAVPQPLFAQAVAALGEPGVAELVGLLGYYTLVAMTLKAFDLGLPEGATSDLA